jgi:hypothetical protein
MFVVNDDMIINLDRIQGIIIRETEPSTIYFESGDCQQLVLFEEDTPEKSISVARNALRGIIDALHRGSKVYEIPG